MAGRLTMFGASALLTSYFSKRAEAPTSFWLALIRSIPPDPYMNGTEIDEPDADDYARTEIVNDLTSWSNDSQPQEVMNLLPAAFITATTDWGMLNYWALCDSAEGGNNVLVGSLESPVAIAVGDSATIDVGDISLSLGPFFLVEEQ